LVGITGGGVLLSPRIKSEELGVRRRRLDNIRVKGKLMKEWRLIFFTSVVALLVTFASFQLIGFAAAAEEKTSGEALKTKSLEETWGIQIMGIRQTAAGHMIDFRYRVLDPKKAGPLFERRTKPYLIDQASGKVLAVPRTAKVGPLRTSEKPQEGRIYWMFFGNPGVVKPGNKVTVVIGEFKVENLTVQ
jgi:hypothetical protein